jgi:hypothetical protein
MSGLLSSNLILFSLETVVKVNMIWQVTVDSYGEHKV